MRFKVIVVYKVTESNNKVFHFSIYFSIYLSYHHIMYPCISCSAVFDSEDKSLYHLIYNRCVSVAGQAALFARRSQQQTVTDDAFTAVMAVTDMPIKMGMDEDTPLITDNQVTESEAIDNENVDSEMTEADVVNSTNEHDSCKSTYIPTCESKLIISLVPNPITFN